MFYWYRPRIHLCQAADAERALCGTSITGLSPTTRPLPGDAEVPEYFADRDADVCGNCVRVYEARSE